VQTAAAAVTTTVPAAKGWTSTQTLMMFVGVLILALVFAPGVASRVIARRDE